jgi:hypothetical protein
MSTDAIAEIDNATISTISASRKEQTDFKIIEPWGYFFALIVAVARVLGLCSPSRAFVKVRKLPSIEGSFCFLTFP